MEVAEYYNIELEEDKLHDSDYDVELTVKIFEKLCQDEYEKERIKDFLLEDDIY